MTTLGDVIAALRASLERLPFTELADALDAAEEARGLIEQVSAGSGQAEFQDVLDWFSQVTNGIDALQSKLSAIHASVTDIVNRGCPANCPSGWAVRRPGSGSTTTARNTTS